MDDITSGQVAQLLMFTCSVKQSQSVRLPADHHRYCIVIKNLTGE